MNNSEKEDGTEMCSVPMNKLWTKNRKCTLIYSFIVWKSK